MMPGREQYTFLFPLSAGACVGGLYLGFANPFFHFPPFIFLFFLGLNCIALNSGSYRQVFRNALLASGLAFSACLYWIVVPVHVYGGFPFFLAVFCPLLLGFCIGFIVSLYALFIFTIKDSFSWFWLGVFGGCAWAGIEFAREYVLTGFPWFVAAQSFAVWPQTVQSVSIIGSFGLAMIMTACGMWLTLKTKASIFTAAAVLIIIFGYGFFLPVHKHDHKYINVLAVQGNIDQTIKWEQDVQLLTINKYIYLTEKGMDVEQPDLVIWPETAIPFYFQEPTDLAQKIREFVRHNSLNLIAGSPAYIFHEDRVSYSLFNRAYWISRDGFILDYYDKEHLVPFGEYVPLSRLLPFVEKLVPGEMDFSPGEAAAPMTSGDLALGVLICYEIIYPNLVRQRVAQGANLLTNLSNDAWFGNTSAPVQHLHLGVLRAIEQNRYVVRATNSGISAFIDPRGNIFHRSGLKEDAFLLDKAGLVEDKSIYFHLHWVINCLLLAGILLSLILRKLKKTKKIMFSSGLR